MIVEPQRIPLELELPNGLSQAIDKLETAGAICLVVGGSIRDALLGMKPKDFDIEVYGLPLEKIEKTLSTIGKTDLVGKAFSVVKLWTQGEEYDFAIPRRESKTGAGHRGFAIEADASMNPAEAAQRRDFTCNALFYDPARQEVVDHYGGIADLKAHQLRHVSPAFSEDPLRALRAMQFAGRFALTLHPETAKLCRAMRHEFHSLAVERIWTEWEKWATRSTSLSHGMLALQASGWLPFFAELNALVDLPQDPEWHPEGDVWTHTLRCLDALQAHTNWATLPPEQRCAISFATLCHDLGKARCTRFASKRGEKRWISPGHDSASAWLSETLLARIATPKHLREKVSRLVGNHHYLNTAPVNGPSNSSLRRLAKRLEPASARELVYVMIADHRGRPPLVSEEQERYIKTFQTRIQELELKDSAPKPILLGRHLIALGHKPGKAFKAILDAAYEAQLDGAFEDETGAKEWLAAYSSRS